MRRLRLKALLGALAVSVLILPFAVTLVISLALRSRILEGPVNRFVQVSLQVEAAVELEAEGPRPRSGWKAPDWLELLVTDSGGRVVLATAGLVASPGTLPPPSLVPALAARAGSASAASAGSASAGSASAGSASAGSAPAGSASAGTASAGTAGAVYYEDRLSAGGRTIGRFHALATPPPRDQGAFSRNAVINILLVGVLALVSLGGSFSVAAALARAVTRLEDAAGRIASGDLESPVDRRGVAEIASLAGAMDRMRERLREDQSRRARFLAAVSHDLRTPLTALRGYLEAVEDGLASDPATLERYLGIARDKGRLLAQRIDELIEFARMETGEWRLRFEELDLGLWLGKLAEESAWDAAAAGLVLRAELEAARGRRVEADPGLLARAFENLVANALRYAPAGTELRLLALAAPGGGLEIALEDEGPGLDPGELERVFEAWYRGRAAAGPAAGAGGAAEGLGLGLGIARSIIRGHGWELVAKQAARGGARFAVRIPPAGAPPRPAPRPAGAGNPA